MGMKYDISVIGAGPAGLMAAKRAAEHGLKVILIEKRKEIANVTRACCQNFIMDEGYQRESIKIDGDKVIFPINDFEVTYQGPLSPIIDKYYISPKGHAIHFAYPDRHPIAFKFNKGILLEGLYSECVDRGVEFRLNTLASRAREIDGGVLLETVSSGKKFQITSQKCLIADGVNSRIAHALGFNEGRSFITRAFALIYELEKVKDFNPSSWKAFFGASYGSKAPVLMGPSNHGEDVMDLLLGGDKTIMPEQIYHFFTTKSPLAYMFEKSKVVGRKGCSLKACAPLKSPCRGNTIVIGDAAAYVEVQTQGAFMCGYRAGDAVYMELNGEQGFTQYTKWWQESFEFNGDGAQRVAQGYALVPTYTDSELDYLFSLAEDKTLEGTWSQYKTPKLMWECFLEHNDRIAQEKPELYKKIASLDEMSLEDTYNVELRKS
jgi:flavin-dependent dehydrogenase